MSRGGGAILHLPGQLAIYPIVPLAWHGWSVGEYLARLENALQQTLADCGVKAQPRDDRAGLFARGGQIAFFGLAVRDWVSCQGIYLNVSPAMRLFSWIDTDPAGRVPAVSVQSERRQPAKMTLVRAALVERMAAELGSGRYHLYTGHPLLRPKATSRRSAGSRRAI